MNASIDEYYLYAMIMPDVEKSQESATLRDHHNEEPGWCMSFIQTIIIGVLILIPLCWPVLGVYFWYRKQPHNRIDLENAPETSGSVSDHEPLAYVDVSEDLVTIKLQPNVDGELQYKLDDEASFRPCYHGYEIHDVSVGHHFITFQFTPIGSSQPLYQPPYEFIIVPTIIYSVTTDKDTATIHLDTNPTEVDGIFQYSLDNKGFQQCSTGDTLSELSAGTHRIVFKFIPTDSPDAFSISKEHDFKIEPTVSVSGDTATIKLYPNTEGIFMCSLDGAAFQQCSDGTTFTGLSVGHHVIIFQFTPTGSSQPLDQQSYKFIIRPTIIYSVTTDKDTATIHLDTNPTEVDGTFQYSLDDKEFQQCSSRHTLSKLSAETHHIVFKFTPTDSPDAFSVSEEHQFEIEPIAQACDPISVIEDTATIQLYSNTEGTFMCSLDEAAFQQCFSGTKFSRLTPGIHKIIVCFTVSSSRKEIPCFSDSFKVGQIAKVHTEDHTTMEVDATMKLESNFAAKFWYSLDGAEFQPCSSQKKFSRLQAGLHCVIVQFIPTVSSLDTIEKTKEFTVPPKANGFITISKDKAVIDLEGNTNGVFQYSLDGQEFAQFDAVPDQNLYKGLQEIPKLATGTHSIRIQLVTTSAALSSEPVELKPSIKFTVLSKDWYASHCPPVRLQNLGNTCFFNSALQSTFKTDVFHQLPLQWDYEQQFQISTVKLVPKERPEPRVILKSYTKSYEIQSKTCDVPLKISVPLKLGPLTEAWISLLTNTSTTSPIFAFVPKDLLQQLGKKNPRFVQRTQEDSHEALRCLFDAIKNEEIEQVKKAIKEHFGATDSQAEASLDGEDKLKMKGYLRMASKVPTVIGQAVEGKIVSVTICHECQDVSENVESFFDISLPMPEESLPKYDNNSTAWKADFTYGSDVGCPDENDENGNSVTAQPTDEQEDFNEKKSQNDNLNTGTESEIGKPLYSSQINTSSTVPDKATSTNTESQSSNEHSSDGLEATNVDGQSTQPADTDASFTTDTDHSVPPVELEGPNDTTNSNQPKEPKSLEGSDTGLPAITVPATAPNLSSDNTDMKSELNPVSLTNVTSPGGASALPDHQNIDKSLDQQGTEEISSGPAKLSASQKAKQEHQKAEADKLKYLITHNKNEFQEYLIKKGLNYQPKGKQVETTDLQFCLSMYTDLDVLDENNMFICQACTKQKQLSGVDEPALCQVSKQIMIHQLPPILILHMKRFEIGFDDVTKDDRHISFPEVLDMAPYCTAECLKNSGDPNGKISYGLYAVVVHQGYGLHSGHYIAHVKTRPTEEKNKLDKDDYEDGWYYDESYCKKGQWYYTSDSYVQQCSLKEVKESKAYMLFYERLPIAPATLV